MVLSEICEHSSVAHSGKWKLFSESKISGKKQCCLRNLSYCSVNRETRCPLLDRVLNPRNLDAFQTLCVTSVPNNSHDSTTNGIPFPLNGYLNAKINFHAEKFNQFPFDITKFVNNLYYTI